LWGGTSGKKIFFYLINEKGKEKSKISEDF